MSGALKGQDARKIRSEHWGKCGIRKHERSGRFLAWKEGMFGLLCLFCLEQKTWWRFAEALVFWQEPTNGTDPFKCQQPVRLLECGSGGWGWNHDALQISILYSLLKGQMFNNFSRWRVTTWRKMSWGCKSLLKSMIFLSSEWIRCWSRWFMFFVFFLFATSSQPAQVVDLLICNQKRFINIPLVFGYDGIHPVWRLQEAGVNVHGFFLQAVFECGELV